jgi:hypothetical protein
MARPRPIHFAVAGLALVAWILVPAASQPGRVPCHRDLLDFFLPMKAHLARSLAEGSLPWWDPFTLGGVPFFANLQSQVLYPPNLLAVTAAGPEWGLALGTALHLWIAGTGAVLLARALGRSLPASTLAGVALMAGGPLVSLQDLHNQLCTLAWAPWACLGALLWADRGGIRWIACWTAAMVAALLGGEPQVALLIGALSTLVAAVRLPKGGRVRALFVAIAVASWTAACAAVQIVPFAELALLSDRLSGDYAQGGRHALDPGALAALVIPPSGPFDGPAGSYVRSIHLGALVVALALAGALSRSLLPRALAAAALACTLLALGPHLPLVGAALVDATPFLRYPVKYFQIPAVVLPILAAFGLDLALRALARPGPKRRALAWAVVALAAAELVPAQRRLSLSLPASLMDPTPALSFLFAQTAGDGPRVHPLPITAGRIDRRAALVAAGDVFAAHRSKVELLEGGLPAYFGIHATTGGAALVPLEQARLLDEAGGPLPPALALELHAGFVLDEAVRRLPLPVVPLDGGAAFLYVLPSAGGPYLEREWRGPNVVVGLPGEPAPSTYPGWREVTPGTWRFRPRGLFPLAAVSLASTLALAWCALRGRRGRRLVAT